MMEEINNNAKIESASIFNIERFATEDGHGIRTVVFMKGCTLKCNWCANPESQSFKSVVIYNENLCKGCGKCIEICPVNAIKASGKYKLISDPELCIGCGKCVDTCLYNARTMSGKEYSVDLLIEQLLKDRKYYEMSGGGVTFSGGEPLLFNEFIRQTTIKLKEYKIPVLIETCGDVDIKAITNIIDIVDAIYYDFKHIDAKKHKLYTGKDNKRIIENLIYLNNHFPGELSVRYPYIPGVNDNIDDIDKAVKFITTLTHVTELVFLPYHRLGLPKYLGLGRDYEMGDMESLKRSELYFLLDRYSDKYVNIRIG